jgi:hypothetical protein
VANRARLLTVFGFGVRLQLGGGKIGMPDISSDWKLSYVMAMRERQNQGLPT